MRGLNHLAVCFGLSLLLLGCNTDRSPLAPPPADAVLTSIAIPSASGSNLLVGYHLAIDPNTLQTTVTPHRTGSAQPPQGQTYDLDIANFQNADSLRITGIQVLGSGNFRLTFTHAHPFPAPTIANPVTATNRADLGYTGRLVILTSYNPKGFFSNAVRLSAGAVVGPDGYVEVGDLLAHTPLSLVTAYPYKLLADEAQDNRVGVSNGGLALGNFAPGSGGWQRVNLNAGGDGWTGFDYLHGGQTITNQFVLSQAALESSNFALDVALLIQYTDPRGAGGKTFRLPPVAIDPLQFAYRLPYAALDCSRVIPTAPYTIGPKMGDSATLDVRIRDWDATAGEAGDATVGDETDVALIQKNGSGEPEVVIDAPGILTGLRNFGASASGTGTSASTLLYSNSIPNQTGAAAGDYFACLRVTDPEFADTERGSYHAGVDATSLLPTAARAIPARTWQIVPITIGPAVPVITSVTPTGVAGGADEARTFRATASNNPTSWNWDFGGGARIPTSTAAEPDTFLAGQPGLYTGTVIASNAGGDSAPFDFTFRVLEPLRPTFVARNALPTSDFLPPIPESQRLFIVQGRPVLLFAQRSGTTYPIHCAVANTPDPQGPSDWTTHEVATNSAGIAAGNLINNRLAFLYATNDVSLAVGYAYATVALPGDTSDWTVTVLKAPVPSENWGALPQLIELAGKPYAFIDQYSTFNLFAYRADSATPTGAGNWSSYLLSPDFFVGGLTVQTFAEGVRAVAVLGETTPNRTRLLTAKVQIPTVITDWETQTLGFIAPNSVAVTAGLVHPTTSDVFVANIDPMLGRVSLYLLSGASPASLANVSTSVLSPEAVIASNQPIHLGMHNGRPYVTYGDALNNSMIIQRAVRAQPTGSDWERINLPGKYLLRLSMASLNNVLVYTADSNLSDPGIIYGVADTPW